MNNSKSKKFLIKTKENTVKQKKSKKSSQEGKIIILSGELF